MYKMVVKLSFLLRLQMTESDKESPKGSLSVKWESEGKAAWLWVDSCCGAALEVLGDVACPKICAAGVLHSGTREKVTREKLLSVRFWNSNTVLSLWRIFGNKK